MSNIPLLTTNNLLGKEFNSVDEENLEDEEEINAYLPFSTQIYYNIILIN